MIPNLLKCKYCMKTFINQEFLDRHYRVVHPTWSQLIEQRRLKREKKLL